MAYENLIERLEQYSAARQSSGGIAAEAADALRTMNARCQMVRKGVSPVPHYETWYSSDDEPVTRLHMGYECPNCGCATIKVYCPMCGLKMNWHENVEDEGEVCE